MAGRGETADIKLCGIDAVFGGVLSDKSYRPCEVSHRLVHDGLAHQLVGRVRHDETVVAEFVKSSRDQLAFAYAYDYLIVNDDLDTAVSQVRDIIRVARLSVKANKKTLDQIKKTFQEVI